MIGIGKVGFAFGVVVGVVALAVQSVSAQSEPVGPTGLWKLPLTLNEKNTTVTFEVDTTWHVVYGTAHKVSGELSSTDPTNPLALKASIQIPVAAMDTGWDARDDSFYEHIESEKFAQVAFLLESVSGECSAAILEKNPCAVTLSGKLTIRDVTKDVALKAQIVKKEKGFTVSGATTFPWASYGMKDPSIIVAKVQPEVTVKFAVDLPAAE